MPLIKLKAVGGEASLVDNDSWQFVADDAELPAKGDVVVGLKRLLGDLDALRARSGKLGVRIDPEDELDQARQALDQVALVALTFPKFGDGRAYSKARLFRDRFGYKGELRAVGEVLADQLQYMSRCGFDALQLAEGKDVAAALRALNDFTVTYQGASDDPRPLYRRVKRGERTA
ncbi:MAG TPA: DUF934 domain-containing protein [Polyangiales bacterium]